MRLRKGNNEVVEFGPTDARSWFDPRPSDNQIRARRQSRHLKAKYGLTEDEYELMLEAQGGVCAICHRPERVRRGPGEPRLSVDHDHITGMVRGLLCQSCNVICGMFRDDPIWANEFANRMASYLAAARLRVVA